MLHNGETEEIFHKVVDDKTLQQTDTQTWINNENLPLSIINVIYKPF